MESIVQLRKKCSNFSLDYWAYVTNFSLFQTSCYPNDFCYESIFVTIFRNRTMQKVTERIVKELFEYVTAVVVFSGELRA